jgi:hypothetical protein
MSIRRYLLLRADSPCYARGLVQGRAQGRRSGLGWSFADRVKRHYPGPGAPVWKIAYAYLSWPVKTLTWAFSGGLPRLPAVPRSVPLQRAHRGHRRAGRLSSGSWLRAIGVASVAGSALDVVGGPGIRLGAHEDTQRQDRILQQARRALLMRRSRCRGRPIPYRAPDYHQEVDR